MTTISNPGVASGGSVSHSGNISQTVHVAAPEAAKPGWAATLVVPVLAAVLAAVAGAYAKARFDLWAAPEQTAAGTRTLLGQAAEARELATARKAPPELIDKLVRIEQQARAVEANVALLQKPKGQLSSQADFWLRRNTAVVLGNTTSFGVTSEYGNGALYLTVNGGGANMNAGGRYNYKDAGGKACFVTYVGKAADAELYGFKLECA